MFNKGTKIVADNSTKFYCLKFNKSGHFGIPFFAINDAFAKNRIYQALISGTAPELVFDTDVELHHLLDFYSDTGEVVTNSFKICNLNEIKGVSEFIENVKKNDTIFKE